MSALPAAWSRCRPQEVAQGLADVLGGMLSVNLVLVRVQGPDGAIEAAWKRGGGEARRLVEEVRRRLDSLEPIPPPEPLEIVDPAGGARLRFHVVPIGCNGDRGVVAAGSAEPGFPGLVEKLLSTVAVGQVAVVLERLQAEETLRRSGAELADFFNNAAIGMHWVGPDGTILRANRAELELLGYAEHEYIGRNIVEFHDDDGAIRDVLKRLRSGEVLREYEARMRCKDGSTKDVLIDSNVLFRDGRFVHTRCFSRDITAQKQAERLLQESEARFRSLVETTSQVVWSTDGAGRIVEDSPSWRAFTGQSLEQWMSQRWIDALHPADRARTEQLWRECLAERRVYATEYRLRTADGSYRWTSVRAVPVREADGTIREWIGMNTDITDRKEAEDALRESEERYRRLAALLPVGLYTCEAPSGAITFFNQHAADLWGRTPRVGDDDERFCGSFRLWRCDGTLLPHDRTPMAVALREGHSFRNEEVVIERPDGSRITVLVNIDPLRDEEGRVTGAINAFHDTTALKQAEAELRESELRFRQMIDALPAAVYTVDAAGRLTHFNRACLEFSGREPRLGTDTWCVTWKLYHADGRPLSHDECPMAVAIREGRTVRGVEVQAEQPDGTRRWFIPFPSPLRDASGRITGGINMLVDITDRKRVEAEREQLHRQLETELADAERLHDISAASILGRDVASVLDRLLDAAVGIMKADMASLQAVDETENALRTLAFRGFEPESGRTFLLDRPEAGTPSSRAWTQGRRVVVQDGEAGDTPAGVPLPDCHRKAGIRAVQATPLVGRDGRTIGVISTHWREPHRPSERDFERFDVLARQAADLLEHKQSEEALRKQTERLKLLWEAASVLMTANDPDAMLRELFSRIGPHLGLDTYFNFMIDEAGDALRLHSCVGVPDTAVHSLRHLEFGQAICGTVAKDRQPIHATDIQQSDDPQAQLVKSFGISAYVCNPLISGGELLGTLTFASRERERFDEGELAFLETICHYVTVAYERLRLLNRLQETDRRKDEFLATLAHELRNPLAPIRNAVSVLRLKGPDEPELRWGRDVIDRQVSHLTRLIDDLLDISRITRNRLELRKQTVGLIEVIRGAIETSRPLIEECGHELAVELPAEPILLQADLVRLAQVFMNLLNNAAKYTHRGGRICLSAERQGGTVVVRVKDNGLGIPPEKLPHLFELFYQVDHSLERSQGGLGIGLSLVRRLVELHGGSVKAYSAGAGKGTEFTVRLPVLANTAQPEPQPKSESAGPLLMEELRRILVVDDIRDNAESLALLLRLRGNEVRTAFDGLAAVEEAERFRPELMLIDIGMPKLNGYDVCRRIREQPWGRDMLMVALTGWGQEEDKRCAREAGFDAHLVKPVEHAALTALIPSLGASRGGLLRGAPTTR